VSRSSEHEDARRRINRLERRAQHLRLRIARDPNSDLSYGKAELSALEWALPILRATLQREPAA
jgi:hypothetical protein